MRMCVYVCTCAHACMYMLTLWVIVCTCEWVHGGYKNVEARDGHYVFSCVFYFFTQSLAEPGTH